MCLKLGCQDLFFGGELSNALEEVLMTSYASADFTSYKVAGVTHRGSVAEDSLVIPFWGRLCQSKVLRWRLWASTPLVKLGVGCVEVGR